MFKINCGPIRVSIRMKAVYNLIRLKRPFGYTWSMQKNKCNLFQLKYEQPYIGKRQMSLQIDFNNTENGPIPTNSKRGNRNEKWKNQFVLISAKGGT